MAISFVGSATGTDTITLPAHVAGDLLIAIAGAQAAITTASGWTLLDSASSTNTAVKVAYKFATTSSEANPTFTGALASVVAVYRDVASVGVLETISTGGSSSTIQYDAASCSVADGTSWVLALGWVRSNFSNIENAAAGYTTRNSKTSETGTGTEVTLKDTAVGVASVSAATTALGGSAVWRSGVVELVAKAPPPVLTAENATYSLTGTDVGVLFGRLLASTGGAFTLAGDDVGFLIGRIMPADDGAFSVTGENAGLLTGRVMSAVGVAFTLTGGDADFTAGQYLFLDAGSFALAGGDATFRRSIILPAVDGSFALVGQSVDLFPIHYLTASAGSFVLAGQEAMLRATRRLAMDSGTYALAGQAATLRAARSLSLASGFYALTGEDVTIIRLTPFIPLKRYEGSVWNTYRLKQYRDGQWIKPRILRYVGGSWVEL